MSLIETKVICTMCGEVLDCNAGTLNRKTVISDLTNNEIEIYYMTCKRCGTILVVQLNDEYTKELTNKIFSLLTHESKHRGSIDRKRVEKIRKKLSKHREYINEFYEGSKFFDLDKNIFIERLTMVNTGDNV